MLGGGETIRYESAPTQTFLSPAPTSPECLPGLDLELGQAGEVAFELISHKMFTILLILYNTKTVSS